MDFVATISLRTFLSLGATVLLLLLPSGGCFAYVSTLRGTQRFFELGTVLLFLGSCAVCGAVCHARASRSLDDLTSQPRIGIDLRYVVYVGLALGFLSLACGISNCVRPSLLGTLPTLLSVWIVTLAVVVPIDSAFFWQHRPTTMALSMAVPFGFCMIFPVYVFARTKSKSLTAIAATAIALTLVGWVFWLIGAEAVGYFD